MFKDRRLNSTLYNNESLYQVDPYLCLVGDSKLQISDAGLEKQNAYGSKEDNSSALKSLSDIKIDQDLTKESLVAIIVRSLDNVLEVTSFLKGLIVSCHFVSDGF